MHSNEFRKKIPKCNCKIDIIELMKYDNGL